MPSLSEYRLHAQSLWRSFLIHLMFMTYINTLAFIIASVKSSHAHQCIASKLEKNYNKTNRQWFVIYNTTYGLFINFATVLGYSNCEYQTGL